MSKNEGKNPAAVALGKLGGKAKRSGPRGLAALSPERRKEIAAMGGAKSRTGEAGQAYIERQRQERSDVPHAYTPPAGKRWDRKLKRFVPIETQEKS